MAYTNINWYEYVTFDVLPVSAIISLISINNREKLKQKPIYIRRSYYIRAWELGFRITNLLLAHKPLHRQCEERSSVKVASGLPITLIYLPLCVSPTDGRHTPSSGCVD